MNDSFDWNTILAGIIEFFHTQAVDLVLVVLIIFLIERIITFIADHYVDHEGHRLAIKKWTRYTAVTIAFLWIITLYGIYRENDVFFIIGIILAGVAISMRDVFSNFVGWLLINSAKGFKQGDRIKLGVISGDVIDIGVLRTVLAEIGEWVEADQSTGRLVSVPNSLILSQPLYNYTEGHDFIWNEFKVLITFESDWSKAEELMLDVVMEDFESKKEQIMERLKRVRKHYLLRYNFISPKVYVTIGDSGILLTLRYMVRARRRRTSEDAVAREILNKFQQEKSIDFAYPTVRVYRRAQDQLAPNLGPDIVP